MRTHTSCLTVQETCVRPSPGAFLHHLGCSLPSHAETRRAPATPFPNGMRVSKILKGSHFLSLGIGQKSVGREHLTSPRFMPLAQSPIELNCNAARGRRSRPARLPLVLFFLLFSIASHNDISSGRFPSRMTQSMPPKPPAGCSAHASRII